MTTRPASRLYLQLPFRASPPAVLEISGDFPVTETEWDIIMTILATMKPALVTTDGAP